MKNTKKIYVVGGANHYAQRIENHELTDDLSTADIVMFTGGEDVDPSLYGCKKHRTTYSNIARDLYEKEIFSKVSENQLVIGFCRGSQFLTVMNGGLLVQNCTNHAIAYTHRITNGNKIFDITSTHHQMQYPFNLPKKDYTVLYTCYGYRSDCYDGDKIDINLILNCGEPEIVLYHKKNMPKCLAIQGHPEMMSQDSPANIEINAIINNLLNEKD